MEYDYGKYMDIEGFQNEYSVYIYCLDLSDFSAFGIPKNKVDEFRLQDQI